MIDSKLYQIYVARAKYPHIFEKGTVPIVFPICVSEYEDPEGDIPVVDLRIHYLIDINVLKGKPYEDEVRALVGLPNKMEKEIIADNLTNKE